MFFSFQLGKSSFRFLSRMKAPVRCLETPTLDVPVLLQFNLERHNKNSTLVGCELPSSSRGPAPHGIWIKINCSDRDFSYFNQETVSVLFDLEKSHLSDIRSSEHVSSTESSKKLKTSNIETKTQKVLPTRYSSCQATCQNLQALFPLPLTEIIGVKKS